jgi:MbtH protein
MTARSGPFDPGPEGGDTHLVLANARGHLSLWPAWRAVPHGWDARFGPAPHAACVRRLEAQRCGGVCRSEAVPPPRSSTSPSASSVRQQR